MARQVENKTVVVTGAAMGLGQSIADKFLENGAKVVILLDVDEEEGKKTVNEFKNKYGEDKAVFIKCDVTKDLDEAYDKIISAYKTVDVLVNNAGWVKEDSIKDTMALNAIAVMEWSIKFFDHMRTDEGGKGGMILNMSSMYGFKCEPYAPYYTASKHAVLGFTKSKGHEKTYAKTGVRMAAICPGFTRTRLPSPRESSEEYGEYMKLQVWQDPSVVGEAAVKNFKNADSGTAWVVQGGKPIVEVPKVNF